MNTRLKNAAVSTKHFVHDHKTALAVTATVIICTAVHIKIIDNVNEFLAEHDLLDEMYKLDEED